jgi:streptogramin lyase
VEGDGDGYDGDRDRLGSGCGVTRGRLPGVDDRPVLKDDQGARPVPAGGGPLGIAITPNGTTAYVTNYGPSPGTLTPVNLATHTAGTPITVGTLPHAVAIVGR